jgi:hypothetical protein
MSAILYTKDYNHYCVSTDGEDPSYTLGDNALSVAVTDARSPQIHYKNAKITIPYDAIVNVVYNDAKGEELYNLIQSKKIQ